MADQIRIELVADPDGAIRAIQKIKPVARGAAKPLTDGLDAAGKGANKLLGSMTQFAALAGAVAVSGGISKIITDFTRFESRIAEINTLLPKTNKVTKATEEAVRGLSAEFGKDAADLASAYYDVISAGSTDATKSLELLAGATRASVVGVTDVKTATGAILSVLNAYGEENISATESSQKLFAIVQQGRTTFNELAANIGDIVPIAAQLGVPLEELGGLLAVSTRVSGNTAKSVTQLGAAFSNILKPSEDSRRVVKLLNKELGTNLEFSATALKEKGFQRFFGEILKATSGFKNQQEILAKLFGSTRALRGVLSVTGENFTKVKEATDAVANSSSVLDEGIKDINQTLGNKFDIATAKSSKFLTGFADVFSFVAKPALDLFIDNTDSVLKKQKELQEQSEKTGGAYRDFLGRGAIVPETFDPLGGAPSPMLEPGVDPTAALIDNIVQLGGADSEDNPMMQFAVSSANVAEAIDGISNSATNAGKVLEGLNKDLDKNGKNNDKNKKKTEENINAIGRMYTQGLARTTSFAIQDMAKSLIKGQMNLKAFTGNILGMLGDLAIQIGETLILTGIGMESMFALEGGKALAAGIGLVALGAVLKSFAGGGDAGGATSLAGPTASFDSDPTQMGPLADETLEEEPGVIERQQQVQVVVEGSIFQTDETAKTLVDILNSEFDNNGGRIAYA